MMVDLESKMHQLVGTGADGLPYLIRWPSVQSRVSSGHQKITLTAMIAVIVMRGMIATLMNVLFIRNYVVKNRSWSDLKFYLISFNKFFNF